MDPLQILILKGAAVVGLMFIVGGSIGIAIAKVAALLLDAARTHRAARHDKRPTGLGEQQTQLIHLPAEHTQLFARYEEEMAPLSGYDFFPVNEDGRHRR